MYLTEYVSWKLGNVDCKSTMPVVDDGDDNVAGATVSLARICTEGVTLASAADIAAGTAGRRTPMIGRDWKLGRNEINSMLWSSPTVVSSSSFVRCSKKSATNDWTLDGSQMSPLSEATLSVELPTMMSDKSNVGSCLNWLCSSRTVPSRSGTLEMEFVDGGRMVTIVADCGKAGISAASKVLREIGLMLLVATAATSSTTSPEVATAAGWKMMSGNRSMESNEYCWRVCCSDALLADDA